MNNTFYTDVCRKGNNILVCGYHDGKRFRDRVRYRPRLYLPSKEKSEYHNLDEQPVSKIDFESMSEAREFYKKYADVKNFQIYGMNDFVYTYIYDNYPGTIDYNPDTIKTWIIDIECSPDDDGLNEGFPDIETANQEITAITIKIGNKYIAMGCKEFVPHRADIHYIKFKNEESLLRGLIKMFQDDNYRPDVITGWYIRFFDIPYIINRVVRVLGREEANKISPWGYLNEETIEIGVKELQTYTPAGIAILDYLELYKKFTYNQKESYSLDHIAWIECEKRKVDYSQYDSLSELYRQNFQLFIEYNIADVERVHDIDTKKRFLELAYAIAYDAKVNLADAFTSVKLWDVIVHGYLMDRKIVVPQKIKSFETDDIPGGYVKEPIPAMYEDVVSVDVTSLYPSLVMTYNISPETLVHAVPVEIKDKMIGTVEQHTALLSEGIKYAKKNNLTICANGCMYRKDKIGFMAALMRIQFQKRVEYKKKMKEYDKLGDDVQAKKYDNYQLSKKIQINSFYGVVANKYYRYYSAANASAITVTGQYTTKWFQDALNAKLTEIAGFEKDRVIACDTDSAYLCLSDLTKPDWTMQQRIDFLDKFSSEVLEPFIEEILETLTNHLNAISNDLSMKREVIADRGIWRAKKNYMLNVWDSEGKRYKQPELKIKGIETEKSGTPKICRDKLKEAFKIIMNGTETEIYDFIDQFRTEFISLPFEDIAFPGGVNGLEQYYDKNNIYTKGTPFRVKGSLIYNHKIKELKLHNKYPLIRSKDKIKFCYLKLPNHFFDNVISAPKRLPPEFDLNKYIDYQLMFEKTFLDPLSSILDVIGWNPNKPNTLESFFN